MENTLKFEVGDIAYCTYYGYKGVITEIKPNQHSEKSPDVDYPDWIVLVNPALGDDKNNRCVTKIKTVSVNDSTPCYLQLIMKKEDFDKIGELTTFGYPKL